MVEYQFIMNNKDPNLILKKNKLKENMKIKYVETSLSITNLLDVIFLKQIKLF